jgi:hypothetical protein
LTGGDCAGCECAAKHSATPLNRLQVFDVRVRLSSADCTLQINASAAVLINAVYMVMGTVENSNTTLQHAQ